MKHASLIILAVTMCCVAVQAAEVIPPVPTHHFNDMAHVVDAATAERLDQKLADFERKTSNQIVVVVYPTMQSDSSIEDYTVRVAQKWGIGQKGRKNGVVLFVFVHDRKMYIQVGYGLEGALPDATAKQIIEYEIKPRFRAGDFAGGLTAGIDAIMAATKGEYTAKAQSRNSDNLSGYIFLLLIFVLVLLSIWSQLLKSVMYSGSGRRRSGWGPIIWGAGGGWGIGGGSWGGGGGFSGGGGGFSAGGGSFGGGGAGGSW